MADELITIIDKPVKLDLDIGTTTVMRVADRDHSKLENLDYEHSGHTGFASSNDITELSGKIDTIEQGVSDNTEQINKLEQEIIQNRELIPTKTSELQNDGDGTSNYATEDFVNQKITITTTKIDNLQDTKLDKTGGTITGNLTVAGTVTAEQQKTLEVEDNIVYTNSNKVALQSLLSGLAIYKDGTKLYGILYDPATDSVKLGEGFRDTSGIFHFNSNDGHPVAVRADSAQLTDKHIMIWDSATNKLVDSGKTVNDIEPLIDSESITKNTENKLQAVGIKYNEELITSEMLYNATHLRVFKNAPTVDPTFENNTWETISQVSSEISQMSETGDDLYTAVKEKYGWSVGDTKTFTIESGTNAGTYTAQIWDFNVDTDKDGNKLGIRLGTVELLATAYAMNDTDTNVGGFGASKMATETLPAVYETLPDDFKGVIKETKVTYHSGVDGPDTELSGDFKLFLMSEFEEYGTTTYALQEGVFLKYWQEHNTEADRIKMKSGGTDAYWCWTRSIDSSHTDSRFGIVLKDGTITSISATFNDGGVCLTFNI